MPTTTIAGHTIDVNEEGFLTRPEQWDEELAVRLAKYAGVMEMTEGHWAPIRFLRADHTSIYADRLMEFPTALLGVALGVVLTPQLAAAKAAGDSQRYSAMLDWGLRIVVLLAVPSAVALLTFATLD